MKNLNRLDNFRIPLRGSMGDSGCGAFEIDIKGETYRVIASDGMGWDHVSVSHNHKIPSWKVMNLIKNMFFEENEVVIQIHPAKANYINIHPNVLHLWRHQTTEIALPPLFMV